MPKYLFNFILLLITTICPLFFAHDISSVVDNFIVGTPKVTCGESEVALDIITAKPFYGNIFVKGRAKDHSCRQSFSDPKQNNATSAYALSLGKCGMQRLRSVNPRGINFAVVVVVSFHPAGFITKNDRAFHLNCFYTEPDEIVTSSFEVSQLPTQELSDQMHMPSCKYSVHSTTAEGPELTWANVGDVIYHVWECKGPEMGMLVKKCFVTDGDGEDHAVLDEDGCSLDHSLLGEVTYAKDGMRAQAKSQVFRYADSNQLFFTCQIRMCQRQMDMCKGVTPPKCEGEKKKHKKHKKKKDKKGKKMTNLDEKRVVVDGEAEQHEDEGPNSAGILGLAEDGNVTKTEKEKVEKGKNTTLIIAPSSLNNSSANISEIKKLQRLEVAEEEEEEGEEESDDDEADEKDKVDQGWTIQKPVELRSRRSLTGNQPINQRPLLFSAEPLEVDVATPQMLVLDREDRAVLHHATEYAPGHNSVTNMGQSSQDKPNSTLPVLRSRPSAFAPHFCLSLSHFLLIITGICALFAGLGFCLSLCANRPRKVIGDENWPTMFR